jgi:transposase
MAAPVRNYESADRCRIDFRLVLSKFVLFQESIMTATRGVQGTKNGPRLHLAFELSWNQWKLAFTVGHGQPARLCTIAARDLTGLLREITKAKRRFGLADEAVVASYYEAGRDGFWLHRWLTSHGIANVIVDSASIEVNRRKRRAKSDHLDAAKLVSVLLRYHAGEPKVCSVVRVPGTADEDRRHLHRELIAVQDERTEHTESLLLVTRTWSFRHHSCSPPFCPPSAT